MKVAIYHRVSTTEQRPKAALDDLREAVRRRGGTVVEAVSEVGSGGTSDRPGWQRLLKSAHKYDLVAVWALDRAGRSTLDLLTQVQALRAKGCGLWAVSQGLELMPDGKGSATSDLVFQMLAAVAEFERSIIRARTRAGLARAKARGATLGRPCGRAVDADAVKVLRQVGNSWREVAEDLGCSVHQARSAMKRAEQRTKR